MSDATTVMGVVAETVDLEVYRMEAGLTWGALADLIGASSPRQARAWAKGIERPDAERIEVIVRATGGRVSVFDLHRKRLAYERARKRRLDVIAAA